MCLKSHLNYTLKMVGLARQGERVIIELLGA
jgi:hypothetical protein